MTDWFRIITDLERHLSLKEIGRKVGRDPSAVWRYKGDSEPPHSVGQALLNLHGKYCGASISTT